MAALAEAPMPSILRSDTMLSAEDFETASIHSAAPSYFSDAPSYHSTPPHPEALPPYTPRASPNTSASLIPSSSTSSRPRQGLPPVSSHPVRSSVPTINQFRVAAWSNLDTSNPNLRLYHNIAQRRMSDHRRYESASSSTLTLTSRRVLLDRVMEMQEDDGMRTHEDPYIVGEEAASRARMARIQREMRESREDPLVNEDRVWDRFLSQMRDREFRSERTGERLRRSPEQGQRRSIFRRFGSLGRFM